MTTTAKKVDTKNLLDLLGGRVRLIEIITDFYAQVHEDMMIGFMFLPFDRATLIQKESEFVAQLLGARDIPYSGRSMRKAHAALRIMGGQFARRQKILTDTLLKHQVPEAVSRTWLGHNEKIRVQITSDPQRHCGSRLSTPSPKPSPAFLGGFFSEKPSTPSSSSNAGVVLNSEED